MIKAPPERCFDLSCSIKLHLASTAKTKEKVVGGNSDDLIKKDQWVTWEARHFGIRQKLTSRIVSYNRPLNFTDEMTRGIFKFMRHEHIFEACGDGTLMIDIFKFQSPLGFVGKAVDRFILNSYLKKFLLERNAMIKNYAETNLWKSLLE